MARPQQIIEALELFGIQLDYLVPDISYVEDSAEKEVRALEQEIRWRLDRAEADLARAEDAYYACMNTPIVTPEGDTLPPNCDSEAYRVEECSREVSRLQDLMNRLQQAMGEFQRSVSEVRHLQIDTLPRANAYLKDRINSLTSFEQDLIQVGAAAVQVDSVPVTERSAAIVAAVNVLTSPKMQAEINHQLGAFGEMRGVKAVKAMGTYRAGQGLQYGRHGVDVYGLRNTPRGKTLLIMEVKTSSNPTKRATAGVVKNLLKPDQAGMRQGSRAYSNHRIREAAMRDNRLAKHIRSEMAHGKIRQTLNYVHFVNVATGEERTFRALSNKRGNEVSTLIPLRR